MKDDEKTLLHEIKIRTTPEDFPHVRALARELEIPERRAAYICEKWTKKGWYDYGVNMLAGWLTTDGLKA